MDRLIELYKDFEPEEVPLVIDSAPVEKEKDFPLNQILSQQKKKDFHALQSIQCKDLSFGYDTNHSVLSKIDLEIPGGSSVGIVGPTGSGKSTLMNVICGIYAAPAKQLFLNHKTREEYTTENWKSWFSLSPQDGFLFSTTIEENILLGKNKNSVLEVEQAGEFSGFARDLSQIPQGYSALLGERGINLSGGQRQRVGLARAMLYNGEVLCLDDTLSALDTETEAFVLDALKTHFPSKTTLIIAHRYSAIQHCDHIIYLEDGTIKEQGTHKQLIALKGQYAQVYEKQQLTEALDKT